MYEPSDEELKPWLLLNLVPGLGPRLTKALIEKFITPEAVICASVQELSAIPHLGFTTATKLYDSFKKFNPDQELASMRLHGVKALLLNKPDYPESLKTIWDPPSVLYLKGEILPGDGKAVAIVGSRSCTEYGKKMAKRLAKGLAMAGYTIVSGLARGIDGEAHRGALEAGGRTIAVLAGGLSKIYPPEHAGLALEIIKTGAIVSEAAVLQAPLPGMFPARNRIISGMSKAIILVEAAEKSGALVTAVHASEQGRPVLAVPGSVESPASGGTNSLIRKGAILIRDVDDVLQELKDWAPSFTQKLLPGISAEVTPPSVPENLDEAETKIWQALANSECNMDELIRTSGQNAGVVAGKLLGMEMKRIIKRLPGSRFTIC
ncbi:MAG: DNA-protecting protein DprA [Gemmataceae bacterium]|nr:DNA-protecting protein DprA [Gemmataceae bacterium]